MNVIINVTQSFSVLQRISYKIPNSVSYLQAIVHTLKQSKIISMRRYTLKH